MIYVQFAHTALLLSLIMAILMESGRWSSTGQISYSQILELMFLVLAAGHTLDLLFRQLLVLMGFLVVSGLAAALLSDLSVENVIFVTATMALYIGMNAYAAFQMEQWERRTFDSKIKFRDAEAKSATLLAEMFPAHVVQELVASGNDWLHSDVQKLSTCACEYKDMFFMCSDICGFTAFSSSRKPSEVVELVTQLFATFDHMTDQLDLFKVCTIGDAYIAVNMPTLERVHGIEKSVKPADRTLDNSNGLTPEQVARSNQLVDAHHLFELASGMLAHIRRVADQLEIEDLNMRIGIHRGNFVGGVIGP